MQKLYYSISEVSSLVDEEQHILRYWEKEFEQLRPKKNRGGNRVYSRKDLLTVKAIKVLLREEKLSLKGAKEKIDDFLDAVENNPDMNFNAHDISINAHDMNYNSHDINKNSHDININSHPDMSVQKITDNDTIAIKKRDIAELIRMLKDMKELIAQI